MHVTDRHCRLRELRRYGMWLGLCLLGLACHACDALDPVQTENLCAARTGVISERCAVCTTAPFASNCPQCQRATGVDARCSNAGDGSTADASPGSHDGAVPLDGKVASPDAASPGDAAADGASMPAADGGAHADASAQDAGADASVECLNDGHCDGDLVCSDAHTCEQCNVHADCKASAPRCNAHKCEACTGSDDACDDRGSTPVCDRQTGSTTLGQCVQCTGTAYAACDHALDLTPYVCDSLKRTCTTLKTLSAGDCEPCVSDAQCQTGQICAEQTFGTPPQSVGHFCFWVRSSSAPGAPNGDCANVAPLVKSAASVVSVDGTLADVCLPRISTCPGLNAVGNDCESTVTPGTGDDARCGFAHPYANYTSHENQDGVCVDADPTAGVDWQCTSQCVNDSDCKALSTCDTLPGLDRCVW